MTVLGTRGRDWTVNVMLYSVRSQNKTRMTETKDPRFERRDGELASERALCPSDGVDRLPRGDSSAGSARRLIERGVLWLIYHLYSLP